MSQDTFPFDADHDAAPGDESSSNRKAVLVAGGVAAALVLGAGGYFLLGGGGGDTVDTAFVPPVHHAKVVAAAPKTTTKSAVKLPVAYKAQLGRDPFKALYVVPAAAPAAAPAAPTTPTSTGTGTTTSGTGTTTPGTTSRYTLKLVSISKPSPEVRFTTWSVAGTKTTVIPAQRFGKYGEIVVLAFSKNATGVVDKAIIQVGDDSPISVAVGESVSVL